MLAGCAEALEERVASLVERTTKAQGELACNTQREESGKRFRGDRQLHLVVAFVNCLKDYQPRAQASAVSAAQLLALQLFKRLEYQLVEELQVNGRRKRRGRAGRCGSVSMSAKMMASKK